MKEGRGSSWGWGWKAQGHFRTMGPSCTLLSLFFSAELANAGRPLFPGNDVDDQLKRIFRYPPSALSLHPFTSL